MSKLSNLPQRVFPYSNVTNYEHLSRIKYQLNLTLYSLYYAETCNEFAGPISESLHPANIAPFEEMSQWWRAVGNTVSDLTGKRFEPQTSRSRDECVTARLTGCSKIQFMTRNCVVPVLHEPSALSQVTVSCREFKYYKTQ